MTDAYPILFGACLGLSAGLGIAVALVTSAKRKAARPPNRALYVVLENAMPPRISVCRSCNGQHFHLVYAPGDERAAVAAVRAWAENPELPFNWYDASILIEQITKGAGIPAPQEGAPDGQ